MSSTSPPETTSSRLDRGRVLTAQGLAWRADWVRLKTVELVEIAGSGHYSSVFSCAEIFAALYYRALRLDPKDPQWADRDRFLLGKGHAAIGVYPMLADLGFFPDDWLADYARVGSRFGDHPDMRKIPGIDFSSGSIGHNLSVGVGMALAARKQCRDFRTVVMIGDGELNEGQVWEAAMSAAAFDLGNLTVIVDENQMCLDGSVSAVMPVEPIVDKWRAFGWAVTEIDGHDPSSVIEALDALPATDSSVPTCVLAHTRKGAGVSFMDLSLHWHLGYLGEVDRADAEAEITARMEAGTSVPGGSR
ncbi:MAG: transketolase [Nocardioidaceae bacterium]|nr:transketolase [Nocardioidaceae bacterium]